jgi:hypothetical protein
VGPGIGQDYVERRKICQSANSLKHPTLSLENSNWRCPCDLCPEVLLLEIKVKVIVVVLQAFLHVL